MKKKLIRITTVPISMNILLKGQLKFMNEHFDVIGVTGRDEKHFDEVTLREGVRMHAIDMKRTISPLNDLLTLFKLYRFIKNEKPYIVHTHTPKAGLLGMLAAKFAGVPVKMHTVAGMPLLGTKGLKRILLNNIEKITYLCADKIYPNSKGLKDIIIKHKFCRPDKLKIIANGSSNGINTEFFSTDYTGDKIQLKQDLKHELGIKPADIVYTFVGRLCTEKGINELIGAFTKLLCSYNNVKLLLVGPFEKENGVLGQETIKQIQNVPGILAVGRHDDIRPYLLCSDIFVFPSYREGFPNVVLQAGAMGLPCIVTDINGCNEIITDGHNGLIIPVKDSGALYMALEKLYTDSALREKLSVNARQSVKSKFSQENVWQELLKEYKGY
ncbi:glycosyltransferase family 1 protein [Flavobacterium cyanobacteriorum]|uniref:Glycosyltransferase family 1 protein n=1 Tax=Flavobacterium cyanobacteriorum TaxID=2022802 RepID=A0A255YSC1_9FLAO|nr:glycosyltransferase family 4 protein [Flavobacterium cyanobacteriorum]OYQ32118.1 glycosyltransferase family 1 protein [Flavobacterium cyanobacteriorum]